MFVAKWYTRASRVRIVIAKFDGRWTLPGGPYPIPELVALVGGLLCTLMLLPRLGQPVLTLAVGAIVTALAVGVMRRMPYSPVPFATRVHRLARLYLYPSTVAGGIRDSDAAVSTVRPEIAILTPTITVIDGPTSRAPLPAADGWDELFDHETDSAAELFTHPEARL